MGRASLKWLCAPFVPSAPTHQSWGLGPPFLDVCRHLLFWGLLGRQRYLLFLFLLLCLPCFLFLILLVLLLLCR